MRPNSFMPFITWVCNSYVENMDGNHMLVCFTVPCDSVDCRPLRLLLNVQFYVSSIKFTLDYE